MRLRDRSKVMKVHGRIFLPLTFALIALLLLSPASWMRAQSQQRAEQNPPRQGEQEVDEGDVISVSTDEVLLPVTVRDRMGRLVTTLVRDDFRVFEDGREQPLSDLALRQVPVDVVLMDDASSSVANNIVDFQRAAEGFAEKLSADDRISLIKFDDRVELLQDWTQSRVQLRRALR